jgi:hypothetical protein
MADSPGRAGDVGPTPPPAAPQVPPPPPPAVPPPPKLSFLTKARKAFATVAVTSLGAAVFAAGAERIDPVAPSPAPISCSDPDHDWELTRETKENPVFEIGRYAPSLAKKLGLPGFAASPPEEACPQDEANVITTTEEMMSKGEFDVDGKGSPE